MSKVCDRPDIKQIELEFSTGKCRISVGPGALSTINQALRAHQHATCCVIVTDPNIPQSLVSAVSNESELAGLKAIQFTIAGGEESKSLATISDLMEFMALGGVHRFDPLIAIGGGVVGDAAGFAAAIYMRGIPLIQVPTTLLAMVDSSIGGKTGVNLRAGKNLVGAFYQPMAIIADTTALETLPEREIRCGLAEIAKYGFIIEPDILSCLADGIPESSSMAELIMSSIKCKAEVVQEDAFEAGRRAILNFGHTLGHAIETASLHGVSHGEAVSIGMVFALALGRELGKADLVMQGRRILEGLELPVSAVGLSRESVLRIMERDKKVRSGMRFVVLEELGKAEIVSNVPDEAIRTALKEVAII